MNTKNARLRVPATMLIVGTAIALAALASGWGAALGVEGVTLAATIGYYVVGGRDSDLGAALGGRADERQSVILNQASGLAGVTTTAVALLGFIIATAVGASAWQFGLMAGVGGAAFSWVKWSSGLASKGHGRQRLAGAASGDLFE